MPLPTNTGLRASTRRQVQKEKLDKSEAVMEMRKVLHDIYLDPESEELWNRKRELTSLINPYND